MEPLFLFLIFLTGCTKYAAAYYLHNGKKLEYKRIMPCLLIASAISVFSVSFPVRMLYLRLLIDVIVFASIFLLMYGKLVEKLTTFAILIFSIESLSLFTSLLFFGFPKGPLSLQQNLISDLAAIFFLALYDGLRKVLEKHERIKQRLIRLLPLMLMIEAVILLIAVASVVHISPKGNLLPYKREAYIMSLLGLLSVMGIIWTAVYLFRVIRRMRENAFYERKYAEAKTAYLEVLLGRENDTRKHRHNFQKHLIILTDLAESGKTEDIIAYLKELEEDFYEMNRHIYHTGNDIIDALTNACSSSLPSDVSISIHGEIRDAGCISPVDLCVIYANLLTNAVEELKRLQGEKKELTVSLFQGTHHIGIRIKNTCKDAAPLPASGILLTTKPDKENHGIGIRSVQECVRKHHGELKIEKKDRLFTVDVSLPIAV